MIVTGRKFGGRYEVSGLVASGGMADVYSARDDLLGRRVALKVLHSEYARDAAFIERFRREAQAAASLNDPRIVSVFDWGADDGTYFIVMEYVDGRTLREVVETEGPLPPSRALEIASEVCAALQIAHQHGIIHRDIKPANIAITSTGKTKVMDFGIARAAAETGHTVTRTGTVMGTASYLSPEQAQAMPVDARSDVYSTGVVLYEMLTKQVPFKADTAVAIAYKHVKEDPEPPSSMNEDVPAALDSVVLKALAKNPDNRYQSAQEMHADLQRHLRGEEVHATPLLPDATTVISAGDRTTLLPPEEVPRGKRTLAYVLVFLLFLGIITSLVALVFSLLAEEGQIVEVPLVEGKPFAEAQRTLESVGLVAILEREEPSESVPDGFVISQNPSDGRKAAEGTKVYLVLSTGPERVEVPNLKGKTQREVEELLKTLGLELGSVNTAFSDDVDEGLIISQDPGPGARVEPGSPVDIVVSSGEDTVRVPNVVGLDEESARKILADRGLNPVVKEVCDTKERDARVLSQNPESRAEVPEGSDVTISVNRAPTVPETRGDTQSDAEKKITDVGLKADVRSVDRFPGNVNAGRVVDQKPDAGSRACLGDSVTIFVET